VRPNFSQTILIPHLYAPPPAQAGEGGPVPVDDHEQFEDFYEEIMEEMGKFGEIETLCVLENLGDHMFGNVYIKFYSEEEAEKAVNALRGRYYAGRLVLAEYSPVTNFKEARCRQFDEGHCARGGYCNFMHLRHVPRHLKKELQHLARKARRKREKDESERERGRSSRSRSPGARKRSRSRSRSRDRSRDKAGSGASSSSSSTSSDKAAKDKREAMSGKESDAERRARIASWRTAKDGSSSSKSKDHKEAKPESSSSSSSSSGSGGGSSSSSAPSASAAPSAAATAVTHS